MVHGSASAAGMPAAAVKNDVINQVDIGSQEFPCEPIKPSLITFLHICQPDSLPLFSSNPLTYTDIGRHIYEP